MENMASKKKSKVNDDNEYKIMLLSSSKFLSFPLSRFIAAGLLGITIIIQYYRWGATLFSEHIDANWFSLGGPSLFWPTAAPMVPICIGLIVYSLLASKKITIHIKEYLESDEKHHEGERKEAKKRIEIYEEYLFLPIKYDFASPLEDISSFELSNTPAVFQYLWLLLALHAFLLMDDGFAFLFNPFTFGLGYSVAFYYLFQAFIELAVLFILLYYNRIALAIKKGKEEEYIINFYRGKKLRATLSHFLMNLRETSYRFKEVRNNLLPKKEFTPLVLTTLERFKRILKTIGAGFLIVLVISRCFHIYASQELQIFLWMGLIMEGFLYFNGSLGFVPRGNYKTLLLVNTKRITLFETSHVSADSEQGSSDVLSLFSLYFIRKKPLLLLAGFLLIILCITILESLSFFYFFPELIKDSMTQDSLVYIPYLMASVNLIFTLIIVIPIILFFKQIRTFLSKREIL